MTVPESENPSSPIRLIAAVFVSGRSIYKHLPGVDTYDVHRGCQSFDGDMPAVYHPPCRCWSRTLASQAKPKDRQAEMNLGRWAVGMVRRTGGVLEHPAFSRLFFEMGLPLPGKSDGWGFTLYVEQGWFGYANKKATWLYICGVPKHLVKAPEFRLSSCQSGRLNMSSAGRSRTMPSFADWLCQIARSAGVL